MHRGGPEAALLVGRDATSRPMSSRSERAGVPDETQHPANQRAQFLGRTRSLALVPAAPP